MLTLISLNYEEARLDFFRTQRAAAKHRMDYWKARIKPTSNPMSPEYEKTTQAADEWNYYNDVINMLEAMNNDESYVVSADGR